MTIDARDLPCPGPVIELRKALDSGARDVVILVADDLALSNVTRFAKSRNASAASEQADRGFRVSVSLEAPQSAPERILCEVPRAVVVKVSSSEMGSGDPDLGALLLRGFIKTLSEVDPLPQTILFYNSGVKLCTAGSKSLGDLAALEEAGVQLLVCGTCLNFFGLTLEVGRVTDMLEIVSSLSHAELVVSP